MDVYGTHGSFEFCRKEFPDIRGMEVPDCLSLGRREVGCHLFESNGDPISRDTYEEILSPDYPIKDTVLKIVPRERLTIE